EPVPPRRLNAKVRRDLETICLKCLHKDPQRRYVTAAALADDIHRFQRGEPIAARPAGLVERGGKWGRRRPTQAAILAAGLLLTAAAGGGGPGGGGAGGPPPGAGRAGPEKVAGGAEKSRRGGGRGRGAAGAVLERAEARLGAGGPHELRRRLDQARRDLDLVIQLDTIRLKRVTRGELAFYKAQADRNYAGAFQQAGLGEVHEEPARVAA